MDAVKQFMYLAEHYSPQLAVTKLLTSISPKSIEKIGVQPRHLYQYSSELTYRQLNRKFEDYIKQWNSEEETAEPFAYDSKIPAWTCWLQGQKKMPSFIRELVEIQSMHLNSYQHTLISIDNIDSYLELPGIFYDQYNTGAISPTHFTDIIRAALLMEHGGLWLDATLLLAQDMPRTPIEQPYYFIKKLNTAFPESYKYPEVNFWEGYFIGGQRHSLFYRFMYNFFYEYWSREPRLVHYLLINQVARIGIEHIEELRQQYKSLQPDNNSCELLSQAISKNQVSSFFSRINDGTYIYKLSRHIQYPKDSLNFALSFAASQTSRQPTK